MTDLEEEARAAAYLLQSARREAFNRAMEQRLAGNPVAAAIVKDNWQPLADWAAQAQEPPDADEEEHQWNGGPR